MSRLVVKLKAIKYKEKFLAIYLPKLFCQVMPLGLAFLLPPNLFLGFIWWFMLSSFTIILMSSITIVLDLRSVKAIKESFFLLNLLLITFDSKYFKAIMVLLTSLVVKLNKY